MYSTFEHSNAHILHIRVGEPLLVRANMFVMSMGPISEMDMVRAILYVHSTVPVQ